MNIRKTFHAQNENKRWHKDYSEQLNIIHIDSYVQQLVFNKLSRDINRIESQIVHFSSISFVIQYIQLGILQIRTDEREGTRVEPTTLI